MSNTNFQLPPSYIEFNNIHTWITDIFDSPFGLPCICGDQTSNGNFAAVRPHIIRICQREDTPCKIEISFHLGTAFGIYEYNQMLSGFSLDTTNGKDGIWHELRPDITDAKHNPSSNNTSLSGSLSVDATWAYARYDPSNPLFQTNDPCNPNWATLGIPIHTFVYDMCDHVSSWLSDPRAAFRISFGKTIANPPKPNTCGINFLD